MLFLSRKRKGLTMCKKLDEIHFKSAEEIINGMDSLPVDIEKVLKKWNITTISVSFEELQKRLPLSNRKITGLAYANGNDLVILYSKKLGKAESRFTLAHELGHCCLHMDVNSSCHIELQTVNDVLNVSQEKFISFDKEKEDAADKYARDLLIPTNPLLLVLKKNPTISLEQLAKFFVVPIEQMRIKLQSLN